MEPGVELLESLWLRPTLEVNGLWGGYTGAGGKTVIPAEAHAKISCRLGPGQDPSASPPRCKRTWRRRCRTGRPGGRADRARHPSLRGARGRPLPACGRAVIEQVHGVKPLRVGIAAPCRSRDGQAGARPGDVTLSYAVADENIHAPNEFFRLSSLDDGLKAWTRLLAEVGAMPDRR